MKAYKTCGDAMHRAVATENAFMQVFEVPSEAYLLPVDQGMSCWLL